MLLKFHMSPAPYFLSNTCLPNGIFFFTPFEEMSTHEVYKSLQVQQVCSRQLHDDEGTAAHTVAVKAESGGR